MCSLFFGCKEHNELQSEIEESTVSYDGVMLQNTLDVVRCLSRDDLMALKQLDRDWIFDIIEKSGYEGWIVVEAEQDPAKANPFEYALKARKYIKENTGL